MIERHDPEAWHEWLLDDIADRDAQTEAVPRDADLPLGRAGTGYDHARRFKPGQSYHLDTSDLALGDRHLLQRQVRLCRRDHSPERLAAERERVATYLRDHGWTSAAKMIEEMPDA